jgi:4-amino-4-deoxy-L-arabinose transferase-like glycosyltransferase
MPRSERRDDVGRSDAMTFVGVRASTWRDALVFALMAVVAVVVAEREIGRNVPFADEVEYVVMAHNLRHRGTLSLVPTAEQPAIPTAFREPGYPVLLAALMALDRRLDDVPLACVTARDAGCAPAYFWAKRLNVGLYVMAGLIVWWAAARLAGAPWIAHAAAFLVLANHTLHKYATYLVSDFLALLLTALVSLALLQAIRAPRAASGLALGAALGLLVLTKAAFAFFGPLVLLLLIGRALRRAPTDRRPAVAAALAFALIHAAIVGAWIARNAAAIGEPVLAQRGAQVLAHRVELNRMTPTEYAVAFLFWTRGVGDNLARRFLPLESYRRFDLKYDDGFYNAAQSRWHAAVAAETARGRSPAAAEAAVGAVLQHEIVARWWKTILVSVPVAYRGLFIDEFIVLTGPALVLLLLARGRRVAGFAVFALPGLYALGFHAAITLNLPRHSIPILPMLAVAGALLVGSGWTRWRARRERALTSA